MISLIIEEYGGYIIFFSLLSLLILVFWIAGKFDKPVSMTFEKKGKDDEKGGK